MKELVENSVDAAATCIGKQEVEKEVCVCARAQVVHLFFRSLYSHYLLQKQMTIGIFSTLYKVVLLFSCFSLN